MRRRILALVVGMTVLVVLAFAIPLIFLIRNAVAQRADDTTRRIAQEISFELVQTSYTATQLNALVADYAPRTVTISKPPGAGDTGSHDPDDGPGPQVPLQRVPGGWVATAFAPNRVTGHAYVVRVFESDDVRYDGATQWYVVLA